jgi:hypothetical protein
LIAEAAGIFSATAVIFPGDRYVSNRPDVIRWIDDMAALQQEVVSWLGSCEKRPQGNSESADVKT